MDILKNFYIFPSAVGRKAADEQLKLNIEGERLELYHTHDGAEERVIVDAGVLPDGSCTMVLHNNIMGSTYALYNFRELLQALAMTPSEFMQALNQRGLMQIDKSGGEIFAKVFLLDGDNELASDTDDFSGLSHCTKDCIHPLDWSYSWTLRDLHGWLWQDELILQFDLLQSAFWQQEVYCSHGGQAVRVQPGPNEVRFKYIETENVYLGAPNCRYTGRAIEVRRLLQEESI